MSEMNVIVRVPVTQLLLELLLVTAVLSDSILHPHIVFTEYLGKQAQSKTFNYAFYSTTTNKSYKGYLQG